MRQGESKLFVNNDNIAFTSTNSNSFKSNKDQGSKLKQTTKLKKYRKTRHTKEQSFYNLITGCYENVCYGIFY